MSASLADLDPARLTKRSRDIYERTAHLFMDGHDETSVAKEIGMPLAELRERMRELSGELRAVHGKSVLPPLSEEEYEALRDSIKEHGQLVPIMQSPAGDVIDGHERLRACAELLISAWVETVEVEADQLDALALVVNLARRQLPQGARVRIVEAELLRGPKQADRLIARKLGVSHTLVGRVRAQLQDRDRLEPVASRIGGDGRELKAKTPMVSSSERQAGELDPYERTIIRLDSSDVLVLDHRRPMTKEAKAALKRVGLDLKAIVLEHDLKMRLTQFGPLANIAEQS